MNIGFIGVGGIAHNYLTTIKTIPEARVAAVCEIDQTRGQAVAAEHGARLYQDHRTMLAKEKLDAVFVCVPPFAHDGQVRDVAAAGIAVFVAKPVDLNPERARQTLAAIEKSGVVNAVGYMWRYADITDKARELLAGIPIGLMIGQVLVGVPGTPWWKVHARSGGQIVEQATHIYDLMRYLGGEVADVTGFGARRCVPDRVDFADVAAVNLRFQSGAVGSVVSTCAAPDGRYSIEVVARDARLQLNYDRRLTGRMNGEPVDFTGQETGYARQIHVFLDAVGQRRQGGIRSNYADALRTLELTLGTDREAQAGL